MGSLSLLQGIFPTKELNWGLLHCRQILYQLSYQGSPMKEENATKFENMVHYFISYACQIVDPKGKNGIVSPQVTDSLPWLQWVGTNWSLGPTYQQRTIQGGAFRRGFGDKTPKLLTIYKGTCCLSPRLLLTLLRLQACLDTSREMEGHAG